MRVAFAVIMGLAIGAVGIGMLRTLAARAPGKPPFEVVEMPAPGVRVTFWCETCDTEVLLLRKGSEAVPRHCGEPMTRREEIERA